MRIYSLGVARNLIAEKNGKGFALGVFMLLEDEAKARAKAAVKAALTPNDKEINVMVDAARESLPIANPLGLAPVVGNAVAALSRYRASLLSDENPVADMPADDWVGSELYSESLPASMIMTSLNSEYGADATNDFYRLALDMRSTMVDRALNHVLELNEDERTIMAIVMGGHAPLLDDADLAAALRGAMSALARHRS